MSTRSHQLAIWLLSACVVIHGLGIAAKRAAGSAHYHVAALSLWLGNDAGDHEHGAETPHAHATIEHHHHDADDTSMVAAKSDSTSDGGGGTSRQAVDLGMLVGATVRQTAKTRSATWNQALPLAFASHVTVPLERPPRPRG